MYNIQEIILKLSLQQKHTRKDHMILKMIEVPFPLI